jgi:hypothetical protein
MEDVYLSEDRSSVPSLPNLGQHDEDRKPDLVLPANTTHSHKPAPLPIVHISKRQSVAQSAIPLVPLKRRARDACAFSDPDEDWSTLPTRRKQQKKLFCPMIFLSITHGLLWLA